MVSLSAGAGGRGVGVLFCGTLRHSRTDLADGYKQKFWLSQASPAMAFCAKNWKKIPPLSTDLKVYDSGNGVAAN